MTKIDGLESEVARLLTEYTNEVQEAVAQAVEKNAKELVEKLKLTSPKRTGKYARSWTLKKNTKEGIASFTVYNKNYGQLTHLLEFGHAKRNGGRVEGIPHILPARNETEEKLTKDIEEIIRRG